MLGQFRELWRHAASPLAIVTSQHGNQLAGMTVSSVTSLSVGPPKLLVSFNLQTPSRTARIIGESKQIAINILGVSPANVLLAKAFAGFEGPHVNPFAKYPHLFETTELGGLSLPRIKDAQSQLVCDVDQLVSVQDHAIAIASVRAMQVNEAEPLIYRDHQFWALHKYSQ